MPHTGPFLNRLILAVGALCALPPVAVAQAPTVERVVQIGCDDCTGPTQFSTIFDAVVSDSGDVIVADRSAPMIRAFDRTGKSLWSAGRSGNGPGEFLFPTRLAIGPDRGVGVVDMRLRRHTRLAKDGTLVGSNSFLGFLAAGAVRGRTGDVMLLIDDFTGPLAVQRWPAGGAKPVHHANLPRRESPRGGFVQPSMAVAASGIIAFTVDPFTYRIGRLDADGRLMSGIARDIPPVRRTQAEMKELSARLASGPGRRSAEGGRSSVAAGGPSEADLSMKPHVQLDGLRFDDAGRLWVLTMRGVGQQSVFDVFSPGGAFVGSVTLPTRVNSFSLAGPWLVTGGDDADDIPRVTLWRVRG